MINTPVVNPKLYHYTNWDGLYGILKSKTLFATYYKYLNDSSEFSFFKAELSDFLHTHKYNFTNVDDCINDIYERAIEQGYIASFCGEHDVESDNENGLLSQWRGYGEGGGFALVFDRKKLEEDIKKEGDDFEYVFLCLKDVVYGKTDDRFNSKIVPLMENMVKNWEHDDSESKNRLLRSFWECTCRYKHPGFREENESRIIALLPPFHGTNLRKNEKKPEIYKRKGEYVPCIELFNPETFPFTLIGIIVGPHKEKGSRAEKVRSILKAEGLKIEVTISKIPYIG